MGSNLRVKPVSDKLRALRGNISATARAFGVTRGGMILFIARHDLGSIVEEARESLADDAESAVAVAVSKREPWAISFVLRTLGRSRGYVERQEVTGKDGGAIEHRATVFSYSDVVDAIAPGPATDHPAADGGGSGGMRPALGEDNDG